MFWRKALEMFNSLEQDYRWWLTSNLDVNHNFKPFKVSMEIGPGHKPIANDPC